MRVIGLRKKIPSTAPLSALDRMTRREKKKSADFSALMRRKNFFRQMAFVNNPPPFVASPGVHSSSEWMGKTNWQFQWKFNQIAGMQMSVKLAVDWPISAFRISRPNRVRRVSDAEIKRRGTRKCDRLISFFFLNLNFQLKERPPIKYSIKF